MSATSRTTTADITYITKYSGKLDSGIAFTDQCYLRGLAKLPLETLVYCNELPPDYPDDGLRYTARQAQYRSTRPKLQMVNGMGSLKLLPNGRFPQEHHGSLNVGFVHDEPAAYRFYDRPKHPADRITAQLARCDRHIFVSSTCMEQWLREANLNRDRCFYLPNTCAEESTITNQVLGQNRTAVRTALGYQPDVRHLALVGTVQPRKGQLEALEMLASLVQTTAVVLHLVGKLSQPAYEQQVRARITRLGLENQVRIHGMCDKRTALEHIYAADALVLCSASEALPMVILEAMQLGTPVFATNVGGVPELLTEACGVLVAPGDMVALTQALAQHLPQKPALQTLATAAQARYWDHFSNARFTERYAALLGRLLEDALPPSGLSLQAGTTLRLRPLASASTAAGLSSQQLWVDADLTCLHADPQWPTTLYQLQTGCRVESAHLQHNKGSLALQPALASCAPLLRMGLGIAALVSTTGKLELGLQGEVLEAQAALRMLYQPPFIAEQVADLAARATHQDTQLILDRTRRTLRKLQRSKRYRVAQAVTLPFIGGRRLLQKGRLALQHWWQARRAQQQTAPGCVVAIFNSPTQMMAFLSLWSTKYAAQYPQRPLVAMIYSTNGSATFSAELQALVQQTGQFTTVIDVSATYKSVYGGKLTLPRIRNLQQALRAHLAGARPDVLFMGAVMSAKAHKLLYETFPDCTLRLFEDGLTSYVPKQVRQARQNLRKRITGGDCAEAAHVRRIQSVDLMLPNIPAPPQYAGSPQVSRGAYAIDYQRFRTLLGVTPRALQPDQVLVATQNFCEHLGQHGFGAPDETRLYDQVLSTLTERGFRPVLRPHPRAGQALWSHQWQVDPRVTLWTDNPTVPLEVLLDPDALPHALVSVSSSCMFYLNHFLGLPCYTPSPSQLNDLQQRATPEHKAMLALAQATFPQLESLGERHGHTSGRPV